MAPPYQVPINLKEERIRLELDKEDYFIRSRLNVLELATLIGIAQLWIHAICLNKQTRYPYDGTKGKPPWWHGQTIENARGTCTKSITNYLSLCRLLQMDLTA